MPQVTANGLQLEYETLGDPKAPPVLLIMGLGAQLIRWPDAFCQGLLDGGYRVIRYDNRDIGLSSKLSGRAKLGQEAARALLGLPGSPPYTLFDMADDAAGLLDALCVPSAHVIGASMGGMIGQILAARHATRVRQFVSIMSTSGSRSLPGPNLALRFQLLKPAPKHDRPARIRHVMNVMRMVGSVAYPRDEAALRAQVTRELERSDHPAGFLRQLAAILGSPSRLPLLSSIKAPTLVIHGSDDPLIPVAAAHDLKRRIPNAELEILPGMGHELPAALCAQVITRILKHLSNGPS